MFPYLKSVKNFIQDCENISHQIKINKSSSYECVELDKCNISDKGEIKKKCTFNCKQCQTVPAIVAWLIQNVDQANWGMKKKCGIRSVNFSEIKAWCQSLCVHMYNVLKPLEEENLMIGLEYYLENRMGYREGSINHNRVDVMIGGYGIEHQTPQKRLLVIELKQYNDVCWSDEGDRLTYQYNGMKREEESPNLQVKYYCDSIISSPGYDKNSLKVIPCVFMHNLDKIHNDFSNTGLKCSKSKVITDSRVKFQGEEIRTFIKNTDSDDEYEAFRKFIQQLFDCRENKKRAIEIFKELKKCNKVLRQDELADMLICEKLDPYTSLLRPDQYFIMFGYGRDNTQWDNYLKNHLDYLYFFKREENRFFWNNDGKKKGIIDVIEGGPGSGKSVLAMLLLRYCLDRKLKVAYVYAASPQVNKVFGTLCEGLKKKLANELTEEQKQINSLQDLVNKLSDYRCGEYARFKEDRFALIVFSKLAEDDINKYDVFIIDDIQNIKEGDKEGRKAKIEKIKDAGKIAIMFYDRHQKLETENADNSFLGEIHRIIDERNSERELFREYNAFRLWSKFRCNKNEGYLTWVEKMLGIIEEPDEDVSDPFDFDVKMLTKSDVKKLAKKIVKKAEILVLTESEKKDEITKLLGIETEVYQRVNGKMSSINENGAINLGKAVKVRGVECNKVLVIIGDEIKYENGNVTGDDIIKKKYRVLLTRGLKECYIYVMDKGLRKYMKKSLEKIN